MVRAVVVNFNGGDLTLDCLRHLRATDWPRETSRFARSAVNRKLFGSIVELSSNGRSFHIRTTISDK